MAGGLFITRDLAAAFLAAAKSKLLPSVFRLSVVAVSPFLAVPRVKLPVAGLAAVCDLPGRVADVSFFAATAELLGGAEAGRLLGPPPTAFEDLGSVSGVRGLDRGLVAGEDPQAVFVLGVVSGVLELVCVLEAELTKPLLEGVRGSTPGLLTAGTGFLYPPLPSFTAAVLPALFSGDAASVFGALLNAATGFCGVCRALLLPVMGCRESAAAFPPLLRFSLPEPGVSRRLSVWRCGADCNSLFAVVCTEL